MKKIETVLAEANLTESQIGELVTLVEEGRADERASLRTIHIQEIKRLEADRDTTIGSLMRELVEARKSLGEAVANVEDLVESKKRWIVPVTDNPSGGAAEAEELVDSHGGKYVKEKGKAYSVPAFKSLSDAKAFSAAITDANGVVADPIERAELNESVDSDREIEERITARVIAEADKLVEEALAVHAPMIRQAQGYSKMKTIVEGLRAVLGVTVPAPAAPVDVVTESRVSDETVSLRERVASLEADVLVFEQTALFEQNTAGMADTTKERVKTLMEAARPRSLNDYADMLAVAVDTVKPAPRKDNDPLNESRTAAPAATTVPQPAANLTGPALYAKSL